MFQASNGNVKFEFEYLDNSGTDQKVFFGGLLDGKSMNLIHQKLVI